MQPKPGFDRLVLPYHTACKPITKFVAIRNCDKLQLLLMAVAGIAELLFFSQVK